MSSLDNFPDWSAFEKRAVLDVNADFVSMAAEMASVLNARQTAFQEAQQAVENERKKWLEVLAQQAVLVVQLGIVLERYEEAVAQATVQESQPQLSRSYRSLRIMRDQMLAAFQGADLEIVVPLGKTFDEIASVVQVENWLHHEKFTTEVVAEVKEPIVYYGGAVVHTGRVVMGAPLMVEDDNVMLLADEAK